MKKSSRLSLTALAAALGLAFAGSALASYTPHLVVSPNVTQPTAAAGTKIHVSIAKGDDATAKVQIFAPLGYTATLSQAAGAQIGTVTASVNATAISPDAVLPLTGVVQVGSASQLAAAATQCTGTPTHTAYWVLVLTAAGQTLNVPAYVDELGDTPLAARASTSIQVCLPSPYVPPASGGAAFGAKLLDVNMALSGVFNLPSSNGEYPWSAIFTPYTTGTATPNAPATVEARSIVAIPAQSIITGKVTSKKLHRASLFGAVLQGGRPVAGIRVSVYLGSKVIASVKTNAAGKWQLNVRQRRRGTYSYRAKAVAPERDITAAGCAAAPSAAPGGCVSATVADFTATSSVVKLKL